MSSEGAGPSRPPDDAGAPADRFGRARAGSRRGRTPGVPRPVGVADRVVRVPRRLSQRIRVRSLPEARTPVRPGVSLTLGFLALIAAGTLLLLLPFATVPGRSTDLLTALFTATSAVCVTGLTVVSTADHWSFFGQAVILALIQVGALGFVVGAIVVLTLAGRRASTRERMLFGSQLGLGESGGLMGLVARITLFTLAAEAIGVALLLARVAGDGSVDQPLWWSVFHAISGFTNAGFDIESGATSMARLRNDGPILSIMGVLSVIGALGFTVIFDVVRNRSWRRLSLESRLVLTLIPAFLVFGFLVLLVLTPTFGGQVDSANVGARSLTAAMHTAWRTAGFSTVDLGQLPVDTLIAIILLMFIGGASASVTGGITVNTFGVLAVATISHIRSRRYPQAFGRRIANVTVMRALSVTLLSVAAVFLATVVMSIAERGDGPELSNLLFEAVSAFAVVGYSTGITPDLTVVSKLVLVAMMFIGRLGALTLAQALVAREQQHLVRFPEEVIKVG